MLNRRQIRIRTLQALYAYKQAKGANYLLAKDYIKEQFLPDLNSMEKQDKTKLEGYTKLSLSVFEDENKIVKVEEDFEAPSEVKIVLSEATRQYESNNQKDYYKLKQSIVKEANNVYNQYLTVLFLFIQLKEVAAEAKTDHLSSQLGRNKILVALAQDDAVKNKLLRHDVKFEDEPNFARLLYKNVLLKNERYLEYCAKVNHTDVEDLAILKYLLKNIFLKNEDCVRLFENENLYFSEDRETLRSMVTHTLSPFLENQQINLMHLDEEWQEKVDFLTLIFKECVEKEEMLLLHIMPKLKNWEYERIADTDKILLKMALVEMLNFPSIPVKVTINEIIEIAKSHSTPRSGPFVNGILDKLSKELVSQEIIKKSGRGMLDNK